MTLQLTHKPQFDLLFGRQDSSSTVAATATALHSTAAADADAGANCDRGVGVGVGSGAAASRSSSSQVLASGAHHIQITPASQYHPAPHSQPLDLALQNSARSSIESGRSDLLEDPVPLSFAPTMAAPPAGYSYVPAHS